MEAVKNIVAHFIDKNPGEITGSTVINKSAVKGSILIHRMYATLAAEGFNVSNYINIQTFGDLMAVVNGQSEGANNSANADEKLAPANDSLPAEATIGIDIEKISNMPEVADFREHPFYLQNFTQKEIAYCSLKADPRQSFLGLFCAKEALCKVDTVVALRMFNEIEITHTGNGKPVFEDYLLSIAHTNDVAVAVALKNAKADVELIDQPQTDFANYLPAPAASTLQSKVTLIIAALSLIISAVVFILFLIKGGA